MGFALSEGAIMTSLSYSGVLSCFQHYFLNSSMNCSLPPKEHNIKKKKKK